MLDGPRDALLGWAGRIVGASRSSDPAAPLFVAPLPAPASPAAAARAAMWGVLGWDMGQVRNAFFWLGVLVVVLLFAAVTNPGEASFRNHLTELSFRRHLADIRGGGADDNAGDETPPSASTTAEKATTPGATGASGTETPPPPIAPFRFANHVAISLRTPHIVYKSFWIYSFASTAPLAPPAMLSDPVKGRREHERIEVYFGCLGHWSVVGILPARLEWVVRFILRIHRERRGKKVAQDKAGVLELRAVVPPKEEPTPSKKNLRSSDSLNSLADALLLGHPHSHSHPPIAPSSRRPSIANLVPPPPPDPPSPLYLSLSAELAAAQSALTDLESQLSSHEQSITDAHAGLQSTLDELRTKRKEDDAERHELKLRSKNLEDQKRQAEGAKREAEKRLKGIETVRDNLQAKIGSAQNQVDDIRAQTEASERAIRAVQEDGAKHVIDTREAVEQKKRELEALEEEVGITEGRNEELARDVAAAEERLKAAVEAGEAAKHLAPEEEMMMMAAAYEAAAQEGYLYGHPPLGTSTSPQGQGAQSQSQSQWQNQAAAYMAEAGMPFIDQSYTARGPGNSSAATAYGNLSRERRIADVPGFEDFGPGTRRLGSGGNDRPVTPPPPGHGHGHSDSESDIYGPHDPGSPNGGISTAFSANLLPQGLFKSLEGDTTPGEDESRPTLSEALSFEPPLPPAIHAVQQAAHEDGSDSGDSGEQLWKTPLTESRVVPDYNSTSTHSHRGGRLIPHATTPPGAGGAVASPLPLGPLGITAPPTSTSIPGLPALPPGGRRWFSGTVSAENLAAYNFLHPTTSNDSLNPGGIGYDPSPFAPSETEKKALALKWGPLSKYPWARRDPGRSTSAELPPLGTGAAPGGSGNSTSNGTSTNWLSSRFGQHSVSAGAISNGHAHAGDSAAISGPLPMSAGDRGADGQAEEDGTPALGSSGDKNRFRFFGMRKPKDATGAGLGKSWESGSSRDS